MIVGRTHRVPGLITLYWRSHPINKCTEGSLRSQSFFQVLDHAQISNERAVSVLADNPFSLVPFLSFLSPASIMIAPRQLGPIAMMQHAFYAQLQLPPVFSLGGIFQSFFLLTTNDGRLPVYITLRAGWTRVAGPRMGDGSLLVGA
jgi:hypothetical protein